MATPQFIHISANTHQDSRPCFNGAGDTVVFQRQVSGGPQFLVTVPASGTSGGTRLFPLSPATDNQASRPDWSWHDDRIAFSGQHDGKQGLFVMDSNGTNVQHIPTHVGTMSITSNIQYPSWYPGGTHIAVTDYTTNRVLKVALPSGDATWLTDDAQMLTGMSSVNQNASDQIAAAAQPPGAPYNQVNNQVWVQNGSSAPHSIQTPAQGNGRAPWFSPDGKLIAFESTFGAGNHYAIYIFRRSTQTFTAVTPLSGWNCAHAKFHPTIANRIVCSAAKNAGDSGIAIVDFPSPP